MNGLKAMLVLLAMVMMVDGISRDGQAKDKAEAIKCAEYTEYMAELAAKDGYVGITVNCKTKQVVSKKRAWEVRYENSIR